MGYVSFREGKAPLKWAQTPQKERLPNLPSRLCHVCQLQGGFEGIGLLAWPPSRQVKTKKNTKPVKFNTSHPKKGSFHKNP